MLPFPCADHAQVSTRAAVGLAERVADMTGVPLRQR